MNDIVKPFAGFWRRVLAYLVDLLVVIAVLFALALVLGIAGVDVDAQPGDLRLNGAFLLINWLYFALCESSSFQATPGKLAIGITVTDGNGERISFGRATGRYFGKFLSSLTLGVGYLMAAFTARKQALHDMIAGCLVVKRAATEESLRAAPTQDGAPTAIVALIVFGGVVVVFGGMLAAIAIPAYQDYTLRAQVSSGLTEAGAVKALVSEYAYEYQAWPEGNADLPGLAAPVSRHVEAIDVYGGVIVVTYAGGERIAGRTLELAPQVDENGRIGWLCGSEDLPQRLLPSVCRD